VEAAAFEDEAEAAVPVLVPDAALGEVAVAEAWVAEAAPEVVAAAEAGAEVEAADPVAEADRVTPTLRQRSTENLRAAARSSPVQAASIHLVVLLTKVALVHRHLVSEATQPPRSALVVHETAQVGRVSCRARREEADAEAAAPKIVKATVEKRILYVIKESGLVESRRREAKLRFI